jgi:hypothetical protein
MPMRKKYLNNKMALNVTKDIVIGKETRKEKAHQIVQI